MKYFCNKAKEAHSKQAVGRRIFSRRRRKASLATLPRLSGGGAAA